MKITFRRILNLLLYLSFCVMVGTGLLMAYRLKAAINGVPSLSILDGWWIEGCIEGVTGWAIDTSSNKWSSRSSTAIAPASSARCVTQSRLMGSFFNTHRMLSINHHGLVHGRANAINRHEESQCSE